MLVLKLLFWTSVFLIVYNYVLFPLIIQRLAKSKAPNSLIYLENELPEISILMAAHNEEKVIEEKIRSIFNARYPHEKIELLIGSDCSTDRTNEIVIQLQQEFPEIQFFPFTTRTGKIGIINQLAEKAKNEIFILTDANVMLDQHTLFELVKHFKNEKIGLVDSRMTNFNLKRDGISFQEKTYISFEGLTKMAEGKLWGTMMGPFGGCFAMRKSLFEPVPLNFLVDDFYLNMLVLSKNKQCINEPLAVVYEDVSNQMGIEFKRKKRISAGNFQNLFHFFSLLWRFDSVSFCFFSHKVIRWKTPFLLLLIMGTLPFLWQENKLYFISLILTGIILGLVIVELLFTKMKINLGPLRFLTHFAAMNLALLAGFFQYMRGIQTSIWNPTERNQ